MNKKLFPILSAVLAAAVLIMGILLVRKNADNTALESAQAELEQQISALTADVAGRDTQIEALTADVAGRDTQIEALTADAAGRDAQIDALTGEVAELEAAISTAVVAGTGNDDVTNRGTYTAYPAKALRARGDTAAVSGEHTLTNAQLQVWYWFGLQSFSNSYGQYLSLIGLDTAKPLDAQMSGELTWQQYFLNEALTNWQMYSVLAAEADARGIALTEEQLASLDSAKTGLESAAGQQGLESADDVIAGTIGQGVTAQDYLDYIETYYKAVNMMTAIQAESQPDEAAIAAWFEAHAEDYAAKGLTKDTVTVDVRHILIFPTGADSSSIRTTQFPEEAWAEAEEKGKALLQQWTEGEATEASFAALAAENSQDGGSAANGGLYTGVTQGQMVTAFNDWCFDPARQAGDNGLVKTEYGYHIMYFVGSAPVWQTQAAADCAEAAVNEAVEALTGAAPLQVSWNSILLTDITLS